MKILQIAPYTTCLTVKLLSQCISGFGYMTYDIANNIGKRADVDMLLFNYRYKTFVSDKINFIGCSWKDIVCNVFYCASIFTLFKTIKRYKMSMRTFVRVIYYWLISGYYSKIVERGGYDIVHIHGCGFCDIFLQEILKKRNQKYVITLHGLNSFSDSVNMESGGKKFEKDFLQKVVNGEFPITVISTGIVNQILSYYNKQKVENLYLVYNSFSFPNNAPRNINIRKKYDIPSDAKILLYVGNLSTHKNQIVIVDVFAKLPEEIRDKVYVLFCGRDLNDGNLVAESISKHPYKEHLIICGNVPKDEIGSYYEQSDAVALLSISEGFGLSLIEGMHYGLPCIASVTIDAYDDIYFEEGVIGVDITKHENVADRIHLLFSQNWDAETIKEHSSIFTGEKVTESYLDVYQKVLS